MDKKLVIVGAGVGGLATAARLAKNGYNVEVYEKLPECGGRAHIIEDQGFKFDTGPSFVMMPDFFKEIFSYCGEDIKDYLDFKVLDVHYKIFYPQGDTFTVYKDNTKKQEELERVEKGSSKKYQEFVKETAKIYKAVEPLLYRCFSARNLSNPRYLKLIPKLKIGKSYWQLVKKYFKNEKLCYDFTFEAMFIGVSPFDAPAFYSVISYSDHVHKIFHPMAGMYQIPKALEKMAKKFGAKLNYNSKIDAIRRTDKGFLLKIGENFIESDRVVVNADYAYAQSKLLDRRLPNFDYSCSVYLMYWGMKKRISNLEHHNLFFANDLRRNLRNIFKDGVVSDDFSFYIHVPTVTDRSLAPEGKDILYVLVPVPNLQGLKGDFMGYADNIRRAVLDKVNDLCGLNVEDLIEVEHKFYPVDFVKRYNIKYAATFGLAHTLMQSAFFRPANYDSHLRNLYFVGASTQPGGGLPPVIASSRIVADLITKAGI